VSQLEKYKDQVSERLDMKEDIEGFSMQELTKVKHMVCKSVICVKVEMH